MSFVPSRSKGDALRRLGELLGEKFDLSRGSTVPTALFSAAAEAAGVPNVGQMPERAERVVTKAGIEWDNKCDSRNTPSGGGATVTLTGLNRLLEALLKIGVRAPESPSSGVEEELGVPYIYGHAELTAGSSEQLRDWDALDRSTKVHMDLQNSLAEYIRELGLDPKSPNTNEPQFDIAWRHGTTDVVVEVKSVNSDNRRQQVRLGIGQVLEYVSILNDVVAGDYRPVLLLSETPIEIDYLTANYTGVIIIGPDQFAELGLEDLAPLGAS